MAEPCLSDRELVLFHGAELTEVERQRAEAHIAGCAQCARRSDEMLQRNQSLLGHLQGVPRTAGASASIQPALPKQIAGYRILRVLGEGGMGVVYEAEQEKPRRRVALKVMRPGVMGASALKRFELESQVLGRLQHPGIAQVYEAGVADSPSGPQPYFAMELIDGRPLLEYAEEQRLDLRARLELFVRIADAVQHAHAKGVIHRDLKPANILVDATGQPKVLDFGVARATDSDIQMTTLQTDVGLLLGTVPYMSPEQVTGDPAAVDTRSDVYALGVVLYELLADRLPYDLSHKMIHEAVRIIREEEPTRLSSINQTLRGDVETIVGRAMEKDRMRRYQTAADLSSDIRRYLGNEPIQARPASTVYQLRKFAARHKGLVGGLVLFILALITGTGVSTWEAIRVNAERERADQQRDLADQRRGEAEKIAEFMAQTLSGVGPSMALGRDTTMLREMMDSASKRILEGELKDSLPAELNLRLTIGSIYRQLAVYDAAEGMLAPAEELARRIYGNQHVLTASAMNKYAELLEDNGRFTEALSRFEAALEMVQRLFKGDHSTVASSLHNVGDCLEALGRSAEALPKYEAALEMQQRLFKGDHPNVANSLNGVAGCLNSLGRSAEVLPKYEAALEMNQRLIKGDHPDVANSLNNVACGLQWLGRSTEALPKFVAALEMNQRLFKGDHADVANSLNGLADCLNEMGRSAEALPKFEAALEMRQRLFKGDHPDVAEGLNNVAYCLQSLGRSAEALPKYEAALELRQRLFTGDHPDVAGSLNNVANCLDSMGRSAEALPKHEAALEMRQRLFKGDHPSVADSLNNVAGCLDSLGRSADALPKFEAALDMRLRVLPPDHEDIAHSRVFLGGLLVGFQRFPEAERFLLHAAARLDRPDAPAEIRQRCLANLVQLYTAWHAAEPDKGYDAKVNEWRAKLDEWRSSTQPNVSPNLSTQPTSSPTIQAVPAGSPASQPASAKSKD